MTTMTKTTTALDALDAIEQARKMLVEMEAERYRFLEEERQWASSMAIKTFKRWIDSMFPPTGTVVVAW